MKGVILAGGSGSRLMPNTKVTNKHLLPVYNQPMIYYPIQTMLRAGINDILILPNKNYAGDFAELLGSGKDFNANFSFKIQDYAGGLAYAVSLAEEFVKNDNFFVLLGDNIIEDDLINDIKEFKQGAKIFLKPVKDPERFGIADVDKDKVISIEEKPTNPKTNFAVIGAYIYDNKAFDYIKQLKPSDRGELEITDLNNIYIKQGKMKAGFIKGYWFDAGTHESLVEAAYYLKNLNKPLEHLILKEKYSPKVVIGIVLYNQKTSKYLSYFLNSLFLQDYQNIEIIAIDNSEQEDNENIKYLHSIRSFKQERKDGYQYFYSKEKQYPYIIIIRPGYNTGFSKANNIIINQAIKRKADYYITSNVDMIYEQNVVSELVNVMIKNNKTASATCKIKKWNFEDFKEHKKDIEESKTNFIDSTGIIITKGHRFTERGQGEIDYGQYNKEEEIFGASGALSIYKISALQDIAFINEKRQKEYFDELMFMYKEDVDLAYRLQYAGYKCIYTPNAIAYHDRSIAGNGNGIINIIKSRLNRQRKAKEWSFLNHHIVLQKYLDKNYSSNVKIRTFWYEFKTFIYVIFREPFLLLQFWKLVKLRKKIKQRKEQIKKRIDIKENIEKLMR